MPGMSYVSTRDPAQKEYSFQHVVMTGLSPDGGLFVPKEVMNFSGIYVCS